MLTVIVILILVSAASYFIYKKYLADKQETDLVKEALASVKLEQEDLPFYVDEDVLKQSLLDALAKAQQAKAEAEARVAVAEKVVEKANETLVTQVEKPTPAEPVAKPEPTAIPAQPTAVPANPAPKRYYRRKNKPKK
jgi:cell division septation protein DedD